MIPIKLERKDGLVRVVRCKDCIYWKKSFVRWYSDFCLKLETCTDENFYCADGERREDAFCSEGEREGEDVSKL